MRDRADEMSGYCGCEQQQFDCIANIQQFIGGTGEAGDRLVRKFEALVRAKVVDTLSGSRSQEVDDCCQFVWIRVFGRAQNGMRRLEQWLERTDRGPFCHWLRVVAVHRAVDWIRQPLVSSRQSVDDIDPAEKASKPAIDNETWSSLSHAIAELPTEHQELFHLWYVEELPWKEIAVRLRKSERTVFNWRNTLFDRLAPILSSSRD